MSLKVIAPDFGSCSDSVANDLQALSEGVRAGDEGDLRRGVVIFETREGALSYELLGSSASTAELLGLLFLIQQDIAAKTRDE